MDLFAAEGPLFRSSSGKPAQVEKLMFERFSAVAGLPKSTANTLRQTASTNYRADPVKRITEPAVMDHSAGVAAAHYDKGHAGLAVEKIYVSHCTTLVDKFISGTAQAVARQQEPGLSPDI